MHVCKMYAVEWRFARLAKRDTSEFYQQMVDRVMLIEL